MAGIYIHIPFCKKACHYCNFHFSTNLDLKDKIIAAIIKEIELRASFLPSKKIDTIYFGGGTPSLLSKTDLDSILNEIHKRYDCSLIKECTLEANPDDIDVEKIKQWLSLDINRLSIGIQSFFEEDLHYMNRAHTWKQAIECIPIAQDAGIQDLSIDLIFGYPLLTDEKWVSNIEHVVKYDVPHISGYALTVEPKTALQHQIQRNKVPDIDNEQSARQFVLLSNTLSSFGYEHYEISNYAKEGKRALHNSNYWNQVPYIGVGPSAHSYDGTVRQWNVANNAIYIKSIENNLVFYESETLSEADKANELIMIRLRQKEGLPLSFLTELMTKNQQEIFTKKVKQLEQDKLIIFDNNTIALSTQGKLYADSIAADLFV